MRRPELGVKQFVGIVCSSVGGRFMVFETGDAKRYLFQQVDENLCATSIPGFPVVKKELQSNIKSALRNGWGNCDPRCVRKLGQSERMCP